MTFVIKHYILEFITCYFSPSIPVSSTNKTDRHDIIEILLKVTLNTINQTVLLFPLSSHLHFSF
jgi:hypothetical protein